MRTFTASAAAMAARRPGAAPVPRRRRFLVEPEPAAKPGTVLRPRGTSGGRDVGVPNGLGNECGWRW